VSFNITYVAQLGTSKPCWPVDAGPGRHRGGQRAGRRALPPRLVAISLHDLKHFGNHRGFANKLRESTPSLCCCPCSLLVLRSSPVSGAGPSLASQACLPSCGDLISAANLILCYQVQVCASSLCASSLCASSLCAS